MKSTKQAAWAIAASAMLAASTICGAQAQQQQPGSTGAGAAGQSTPNPTERVRETAQQGAAAAGAAATGQGQQVDQQLMQQYQQISSDPKMAPAKLWVLETALHNQAELQLSQQAQQKAKSDQVKQIAQKMVQDHQKMGQMLQPVAQQMNLQVPQSLPSLKQQQLQAMTALEGEQFDKKYIAHLHMAHARDVASFQAASNMDDAEQVKQFATQHLPMLQQHKQQVMQTAMAMKVIGQDSGEAQPAGSRVPAHSGSSTDAPPRIETPRSGSGASGSGSPGGAAPSGSGTGTGAGSSGTSSGTGGGAGSSGSGTGSGTGGSGAGSSGTNR